MRAQIATVAVFLALLSQASAHGTFVTTWQGMYPNSTTDDQVVVGTGSACMLCHWGPNGGSSWNAYGSRIRDNLGAGLAIDAAITEAGGVNTDNDPIGAASWIEIGAGTQPGWTAGPNNVQYTPTAQNPGLNPPSTHLGALDPASPLLVYCSAGTAGVRACPCGNAPLAAGLGCNNSESTGGAGINATGMPSLAADTLVFSTAGQNASELSILLQGAAQSTTGLAFGQGLRCVTGSLKRLYSKPASSGILLAPEAGELSVSARSAALGDPLFAGAQREYLVYYRDPVLPGGCPGASAFNATSSGTLIWLP